MLILTIQDLKHIEMVYSTGYTPDPLKSEYIFLSTRYTKAYNLMMEKLYQKDPSGKVESFFWGWVKNPYLPFYKWKNLSNKVGVFLDIPEDKVVISDYDSYCEYLDEEVNELSLTGTQECLQGVFRRIRPCNIKSIVPADYLLSLYKKGITDLNNLYLFSSTKDMSGAIERNTDVFLSNQSFQLVSALS